MSQFSAGRIMELNQTVDCFTLATKISLDNYLVGFHIGEYVNFVRAGVP